MIAVTMILVATAVMVIAGSAMNYFAGVRREHGWRADIGTFICFAAAGLAFAAGCGLR